MFCLKGYNQMLKKQIEMKILDEGTVLVDDWEHIEEGSIKRYTEQMDMEKKMLWQDVPKFGTPGVSKTMDIPKKIEKLINQRCRYAELVEKIDYELSIWLKKNRINVDEQDVFGGSEVYLNPIGSANRIRKEILEK